MITEKKVKREKINEVKITLLAVSRNESLARAYVSAFAAGLDPTLDELADILRREIENAKATIPLVEFDSRLGYEPSMDYMCHREALEWKIALQSEILTEEIAQLRRDGTVKNRDRIHFPRDLH